MSGSKIPASSCAPESGWFSLQTPATRRSKDVSGGLNQHEQPGSASDLITGNESPNLKHGWDSSNNTVIKPVTI